MRSSCRGEAGVYLIRSLAPQFPDSHPYTAFSLKEVFAKRFIELYDCGPLVLSEHPLNAKPARGDVLTETRSQVADREGRADSGSLSRLLIVLLTPETDPSAPPVYSAASVSLITCGAAAVPEA